MKAAIITLILLSALALSVSAIDASCQSGAGNHCLPDTASCTYSAGSVDTDNDGWDDACDAQPENTEEWIDIDADGVGHNADCDDFDPGTGECEIEPAAKQTTITSSSSGGGSGGGGSSGGSTASTFCTAQWHCSDWEDCVDGQQIRSCERRNIGVCSLDGTSPDLVRACGDGDGQPIVSNQPLIVQSAPAAPDTTGLEAVTGNVAKQTEHSGSIASILLALGAALVVVLLLIAALRR